MACQRGIFNRDGGIVLGGDFLHDGKAQTGAVHVGAECAVKRLKHQFAFRFWNARPGIFNYQHQHAAERISQQTQRDLTFFGRVVDRVVDQVTDHFFQQRRIGFKLRGLLACCRAVVAEVDLLFKRTRYRIRHYLRRYVHQIHTVFGQIAACGFSACQRQQLVDGVGGSNAGAANVFK